MSTARLIRTPTRPMRSVGPSHAASQNVIRCLDKRDLDVERIGLVRELHDKKRMLAAVPVVKAAVAASESLTTAAEPAVDLAALVANIVKAASTLLRIALRCKPWKGFNVQMFMEKSIVDCRFFVLFAVAGTLLGSVLCFIEGCFIVLESYIQYFHLMSQRVDQEHVVQLLIEALDMFLIGTAMLIFGVSLYVMFVGSKTGEESNMPWLTRSNLFGLYSLTRLPTWVEIQSVSQAETKIGHAVMMILQVGLLEKFKSIPILTSLDLACFAGAILLSSACIYLLSKLSFSTSTKKDYR